MENETDATPASTSATPAASKYRSRFHIKPNLNAKRPAAPAETQAAATAAESHVSAQIHEPAAEIEKIVTDVEEPLQLSENVKSRWGVLLTKILTSIFADYRNACYSDHFGNYNRTHFAIDTGFNFIAFVAFKISKSISS